MEHTDHTPIAEMGQRLRLLRKAVTETDNQAEFARQLDVTRTAWNSCETGAARMGLNTALILYRKFGVSLDWIYLGKEGMMPYHLMLRIAELEREESAQATAS